MIKKTLLSNYFKKVFGIITAVIAVVSVIAIIGMVISLTNARRITDELNVAESAVQTMQRQVEAVSKNLYKMLIVTEEKDKTEIEGLIEEELAEINRQTEIVDGVYKISESIKKDFQNYFGTWITEIGKVEQYANAGELEEGFQYSIAHVYPAVQNIHQITGQVVEEISKERKSVSDSTSIWAFLSIVLLAAGTIETFFVTSTVSRRMKKGIMEAVDGISFAAEELSNGRLDTHIDYESKNEFGALTEKLNFSFKELNKYVHTISDSMKAFAKNDLSISNDSASFRGDFKQIADSLNEFLESISGTLKEIKNVSQKVGDGAEQIAGASQNVAEGATDQSAGVQEISATINELSEKISNTASTVKGINQMMLDTKDAVNGGSVKMEDMKTAMQAIADKSEEIRQITNKINEITAQTNLLSLNASIEAARAGEAGRGFAVVANEVSALATQSASAAREIEELIGETIVAVETGTQKVEETAEVLSVIVKRTEEITTSIEEVSAVTETQAEGMQQLTKGVEAITSVVESNSASSEELAASAQELSGHSQTLSELIDQFKVR